MSLCKDCIKCVIHEGASKGKWESVGGVNSYVATPTTEYPKDKVVLILTDVFGPQLINTQLLADSFAENGYKTIVPDYLNGDAIPLDAFAPGSGFELPKWFAKHGAAETRPPLDKVLAALKEEGVTHIAASGYCLGARYVFDLAFEGLIQVSIGSHPSLLKVPEDLEKYRDVAKAPLLLNTCTVDTQYPLESQAKGDEILGKFAHGYKREYFEGCTHGFAVRGDLSDPKVKAGKEGSFKASVEWIRAHL